MLLCAAGSIFNDLCKRMFWFCLLFFMEEMELSAADTGLIILIGQVVDSLASVISGYLGDMVKVPVLSQKIGMRKSWHLLATVFMGIVVPLCFNRCILCSGSHQTWLPIVYYSFLFSLYSMFQRGGDKSPGFHHNFSCVGWRTNRSQRHQVCYFEKYYIKLK